MDPGRRHPWYNSDQEVTMTDATDLELYNDEVRLQQALQVMQYQVEHNCTIREACAEIGVAERTFYRWLNEGVLTDTIEIMRESRSKALRGMATGAMPDILQYMIELASGHKTVRGASPVAAAKFVLEIAKIFAGEKDESATPTITVFLPEFSRFKVEAGVPEVLEGEVVEE
jgi:hypothetical protein